MAAQWFDAQTGLLLLDEHVAQRESFQKILADDVITDAELAGQAQRVVGLLKQLEGMLSPEAREVATDALCELAVLNALQRKRLEADG